MNLIVAAAATDKADSYSLFGSYDFTPVYSVFARYDDAETNDLGLWAQVKF